MIDAILRLIRRKRSGSISRWYFNHLMLKGDPREMTRSGRARQRQLRHERMALGIGR